MNAELSVFIQSISALYRGNQAIVRNLAYIQTELPELALPGELSGEIAELCEDFLSAAYDVNTEIRNLEDKLGMHPGEEPYDPNIVNPDPRVTMGFIERWTGTEVHKLDALVRKVWALADQDAPAYGLVNMLLTESAGNILQAYHAMKADLARIAEQIEIHG
jgi:hypothetical protein